MLEVKQGEEDLIATLNYLAKELDFPFIIIAQNVGTIEVMNGEKQIPTLIRSNINRSLSVLIMEEAIKCLKAELENK